MAQEKGFCTRYLICTLPGGFADEFVVQGPLHGRYTVRRNALPGETAAVCILKSYFSIMTLQGTCSCTFSKVLLS
jgi:hypothetical protein